MALARARDKVKGAKERGACKRMIDLEKLPGDLAGGDLAWCLLLAAGGLLQGSSDAGRPHRFPVPILRVRRACHALVSVLRIGSGQKGAWRRKVREAGGRGLRNCLDFWEGTAMCREGPCRFWDSLSVLQGHNAVSIRLIALVATTPQSQALPDRTFGSKLSLILLAVRDATTLRAMFAVGCKRCKNYAADVCGISRHGTAVKCVSSGRVSQRQRQQGHRWADRAVSAACAESASGADFAKARAASADQTGGRRAQAAYGGTWCGKLVLASQRTHWADMVVGASVQISGKGEKESVDQAAGGARELEAIRKSGARIESAEPMRVARYVVWVSGKPQCLPEASADTGQP
ncbi:unnamed protein product [Symbiodinium sp. CCMP2592]|nr:unnamed protein product [Symbiodinium sp. CCMP2592]